MFYHGVLFLGLNEMGPVNENEMVFCVLVLVICAILESLLFSEMAEIVTNMNMKTNQIQTEMAESYDVMKAIHLKSSIT
jgi:hypothetical protein